MAFTGRRTELQTLLEAARSTTVVAIDGMGGVGKSALAVHAAHLLTADYPDGQFYQDLHGFTPGREPVDPAEALRVLLTALGLSPARIPDGLVERAALWRSELATRRAIVVLDNAADADHVRDLLPGAGQSFVVITSRRRLVELDGVRPVSLDVLSDDDAVQLLIESAGGTRPGDIDEVLRRCGNLPLAIRVAAARLRHRPAWTLDTLVERLREGELAVADVFDMSLRQLDPAQRRMFQLLGQVPGDDIDAYGAAALAGIPLGNARSLLEDLVDAHLVQEPAAGRYRMHDLLRQAARADNPAADPVPAIARLGDYYLTCLIAVKQLVQIVFPLPITVLQPPAAVPELDDGVSWLDTEWDNLMATFALAVQLGIDTVAVGLGQIVTIAHGRRGGSRELLDALVASAAAAERLGDRRVLASHHYLLGVLQLRMGLAAEADADLRAARALMDGDRVGEAMVLFQLGELYEHSDTAQAVELLEQAVAVLPPEETIVRLRVRTALAHALLRLEKYDTAREIAADVLEAVRDTDRQTARMCLDVLGRAALGLGDVQGALDFAQQAVAVSRATKHSLFEANSLTDVAVALLHLGRREEAAAQQAGAVRILELAGEPDRLVRGLLPYADACLATGDPDAAAQNYQAALDLATAHSLDYLVPAARTGLSRPVPGHQDQK